MHNNSLPIRARIVKKVKENPLINSFRLKFDFTPQRKFQFLAGQFVMVGVPGFGEAAFTLSSNPRVSRRYFEVSIRSVGELTRKINEQKVGDYLFVRGPFGNGFPEVKKNLILIAGGCGFIPLKSVLVENLPRKDIKIQTFIGCKNTNSLTFKKEYRDWLKAHDLRIILEETPYAGFSAEKGFVTSLIEKAELLSDAQIFICGPEPMYKVVCETLLAKKVNPANIYLSLERRMQCGVGVCQHCAIGEKFVCEDGPVFPYSFLKTLRPEDIAL
jgi:NAD(P)H-flavin reductase